MSLKVNNHTSNNHTSNGQCAHALHVTLKPEEQKKTLSREDLEAIIDVSPEMRGLEDAMDSFYNKLHKDNKLPQFTRLFSQILTNNPSIFQHLESTEKAHILFDKYRALTLEGLSRTEEYQLASQSLQKKIREHCKDNTYSLMATEKVDKSLKNRMNFLHSDYIASAIGKALDLKPWDIQFPPEYKPADLDLNLSNVDFSLLRTQ